MSWFISCYSFFFPLKVSYQAQKCLERSLDTCFAPDGRLQSHYLFIPIAAVDINGSSVIKPNAYIITFNFLMGVQFGCLKPL